METGYWRNMKIRMSLWLHNQLIERFLKELFIFFYFYIFLYKNNKKIYKIDIDARGKKVFKILLGLFVLEKSRQL